MAKMAIQPQDEIERLSLFFPIKVVNGFVTCDFKLGCYCCKFCLNRRYPDWNRLLEMQKIYRNSLTVEHAAELLKQVKAFTHAKVTLKIGHDTDMSLEEIEAQRLCDLLPQDQPIVFMRRGKLLPEHKQFYMTKRPNLLMKLTVTPRSEYLACTVDPFDVLQSFEGIECQMFYAVGPVCQDNFDEAKELIRSLPKGSRLWVRELIVKDIPRYHSTSERPDYRGDELREFAIKQGHFIVHYLNCVVRAELGLGFHKRGEFVSEPNIWQVNWADNHCKVRALCGQEFSGEDELQRIDSALHDLGLTLTQSPRKFGHKSYGVIVREDVNFGDECYVRELTGLKVDLSKIGRKTGTSLSRSIARRWKAQNVFPVDDVLQLAKDSFRTAFPGETL